MGKYSDRQRATSRISEIAKQNEAEQSPWDDDIDDLLLAATNHKWDVEKTFAEMRKRGVPAELALSATEHHYGLDDPYDAERDGE